MQHAVNTHWPSLCDYQRAVMRPAQAFRDPQLQQSTVDLNPLGIPVTQTGSYAFAYQIQAGAERWAVRVFQRPENGRTRRLRLIELAIKQLGKSFIVPFSYDGCGIEIDGNAYPIMVMPWVEGLSLHTYIAKNLTQPEALKKLVSAIQSAIASLEAAGIAHGDLQHDNIRVQPDGGIALIDHDGMFVPALAGLANANGGHRNYQHPARSSRDFGPHTDRFSVWLICESLHILSRDNALWSSHGGGNERLGEDCLLWRGGDLREPDASDLFQLLARHRDPAITRAAERIKLLVGMPLRRIPQLPSPLPLRPPVFSAPAAASAKNVSRNGLAQSNGSFRRKK